MSYRGVVKYGHTKNISAPFERREDADAWREAIASVNQGVTINRTIESNRKPEIVRHCDNELGVIKGVCPDCGQKIAA